MFWCLACSIFTNASSLKRTAELETGHVHDRLVLVSRLWNVARDITDAENKTQWRKTILQHISTYFNAKSILTYASLLKSLPTWRQGTCMTDWSSCRGSEMWSVTSQVLKTRTPAVKEDPFWFLIFFQHISTYFNTKSRCLRLPSTSLPPYIIKCPYRGVAHEAELW